MKCLVITNVRGSTIHREVGDALITPAGPEIGVAATKTFTAQITILTLLGLYLAKLRGELDPNTERRLVSALMDIPGKQAAMLDREKEIETLARNFADARGFFFIGRGIAYPPALEGALKLKEISYLHAEAYPAGEMKHRPDSAARQGAARRRARAEERTLGEDHIQHRGVDGAQNRR